MKSDYEPGQNYGVNTFHYYDELITIIHPGGYVASLAPGQIMMYRIDKNLYWCGRYDYNAYMFLLGNAKPVTVEDALSFIRSTFIMNEVNEEDDYFMQGDLPF
ncbi:hypothetical protein IFG57_003961 [Salmonella enterica]|nr:hypothetical protein [Salmonella enterica]